MLNFLKNLSPTEIAIIALIVIVLFGAKLVTGIARSGGATLKEMKKIKRNFTEAVEDEAEKKEVSK